MSSAPLYLPGPPQVLAAPTRHSDATWRARLAALSPDARAALASRMRSNKLSPWIKKHAAKHYPAPPHLAQLIAILERAITTGGVRLLVSMPPRHAKTETCLSALAWAVQRAPWRLNAYVTYAGNKAKSKSRKVRRYARECGVVLDEGAQAALDWRTPEGGGLIAAGIGGGLTGEGIDGLMLIDDPFKGRKEAESPTQREAVWDWFNDVAYTRLNSKSASCIVVATRWHHDDLIGRLAEMGPDEEGGAAPWQVINMPAMRDTYALDGCAPSDGGYALWPERFDHVELKRIRKQVGEYGWASLFQGHPVPKGGQVFGSPCRYSHDPMAETLLGGRIVLALDAAGSENTKADRTAMVALWVCGKGADLNAYVLEVKSLQKEPQHAAADVHAFQQRWGKGAMAYEASRDGHAIARAMKLIDKRIKLIGITPLGDKLTRAQPLAAAWNDNRVHVPMAGEWVADYLYVMGKSTGVGDTRDDEVDATAHAFNLAIGTAAVVGAGAKTVGKGDPHLAAIDLERRSSQRRTNAAGGLFG